MTVTSCYNLILGYTIKFAVYYSVREKEFFEMISIQGKPVGNPKKRERDTGDGLTPKR